MRLLLAVLLAMTAVTMTDASGDPAALGHPRLFFNGEELARLRALRPRGVHARIWKNLAESADWCLTLKPRRTWIAPVSPDPIYANLYDRFYAMMHDMAVMEHLAFAYAYSGDDRYARAGRRWTVACGRIWRREADGEPDASKAYAVMRLLKGLAVSYDLLYDQLSDRQRSEIRGTMLDIGRKYYQWYLDNPGMAGPDQDKHHGSVEASSFGIAALALLGEAPEAHDWLDLMVRKHTGYLLPNALTPSGTQEQSSNYWASTMQYRLFFMDALRRVTGRDLFTDYAKFMDGRIALAAVAGPNRPGPGENNQSILFAPSYGQLDYWSPVLLYLARQYRQPIYQHLALWDPTLGSIQKTRYISSSGEQLLFEMGGYAYAWYDPAVPDEVEPEAPLSFEFPDVGQVYLRASYDVGGIAVGVFGGGLIVHAGGRPVLIDQTPFAPAASFTLTDDRRHAVLRVKPSSGPAVGAPTASGEEIIALRRPNALTITRPTDAEMRWVCYGAPTRQGNILTWEDGTRLTVVKGNILSFEPDGYRDEIVVGMGKLKLVDPTPMAYPLVAARPDGGELVIEIRRQ
jgi:hypothetical protein